MNLKIGIDKAGIPTIDKKSHLGDLLLEKYRNRIVSGFDDLEKFELIDQLKKPVLDFVFYGSKRIILEVYGLLSQSPYSFVIRTKKGLYLWSLPEKGYRNAYVHISRFPNLIRFISKYEDTIPEDLLGLIYGYPLADIHQFTYDWKEWEKGKHE